MWLLLVLACGRDAPDTVEADALEIPLRWLAGGVLDDWDAARAGLWWSLSSMGALPPATEAALRIETQRGDEVLFWLDLEAVGFSDAALPTVEAIAAEVWADPSVQRHGGMDVGRFLMRSLHEPWRYYALTGACESLAQWSVQQGADEMATYAVTDSLLVDGNRLIGFHEAPQGIDGIAFQALELSGAVEQAHAIDEIEVIDVMPNGRQRYAIYGVDGALHPAADPAVSPAGQPGKCLWCHEGALMVGQPNPPVDGHTPYETFADAMAEQAALLADHRQSLATSVDFEDRDVHMWGELLVEAFLHPTVDRVAVEWGVSTTMVAGLGLPQHTSEEYPEWGPVFARADVDAALFSREGWRPVETLDSGRELDEAQVTLAGAAPGDCRRMDGWGRSVRR